MQNTTYKQALSKAAAICSKAEKCVSDIEKKLQQWEVDELTAQKVIAQLKEEKFIDEERYARYFVKDKFRFNKWGRIKIVFMLKNKGIAANTIEDAIEEIRPNEYLETLDDLLKSKARSVKAENQYEKKMKLTRFAVGRGFEFDVINKVLNLQIKS